MIGTPTRLASPLKFTPFLKSPYLSPEDRAAVAAIAYPPRAVKAGSDLVSEGVAIDSVHVLVQGWACRYKTTREGARQITGLIVPGDICNIDSFMLSDVNFGVRTLRGATTIGLPRDRLQALAADRPGVARAFTWFAIVENAILSEWALALGRKTARERLAHLLCELAVRLGRSTKGQVEYELPVTQEQIADTLGLTGVHVNRTLQQLRTEELIVAESRQMVIPDMARLSRIAGFDPAYLHMPQSGADRERPDPEMAFTGQR